MGKQPRIVRAAAFEDDRDLARIDSRNICRFFEGDLEFKRTPHYRRIPTDKFRVNFGGKAGRVPGVNASEADWSAFWKKLQPSIPGIVRTGHTEVVAKALTDELWFKDQDAAFGIQPTLSEEAWWSDVMPDIQALVEEQTRRTFRHQPYWDPNAQSTERDRVALPPAPDDADGDAGASGEPPADAD